MKIDIEHACSFTGHRPERLSGSKEDVKKWLTDQIKKAVDDGYTEFISGMQRGVDLWAAEVVIELKKQNNSLRLIAASAFEGMEKEWDSLWQKRYYHVFDSADEKIYISENPGRRAFFQRNHWMVDHSNRLIGVYTGAPGRTKETIGYAKEKKREIILYGNYSHI